MSKRRHQQRRHKPGTDLLINDIEEEEIALLQARAKRHGRTLDEEINQILRDAVRVKK